MKVLVTSSTGMTGKTIVKALATNNTDVKAMVHSSDKADEMLSIGATEIFTGDIASYEDLHSAMDGIDAIYYICPTAREDEAEIGKMAVEMAKAGNVKRFVYQSVLHSIEPELLHHRQKLEVERTLIDSDLTYTIVQPAPFMQNILNAKDALINNRLFVQKFFIDLKSKNRINLIDVEDFGNAVARVVAESKFEYSTLELCGPENLSALVMVSDLERVLGHEIVLKFISDEEMRKAMTAKNTPEYSIETLLKMFNHYNTGDFCGSPFVTVAILGRKPGTFSEFLTREFK